MATLTAEITMLYCPKCQRKYDEGNQRFCNNDGGRLLPVVNSGVKNRNQTKGVFTNLLSSDVNRFDADERLAQKPKFVKEKKSEPKLESSVKSPTFRSKQILKPKIPQTRIKPVAQNGKDLVQKSSPTVKPHSRLVNPQDLNVGQAELGDRQINPTGRLALTWQNPRILLGQVIKGRYFITQKIEQDSTSIVYMARDKIRDDKFVTIRILMEKDAGNAFLNKFLAEERVALSHIDHPNVARAFDSGELPEGKPFVVSDYFENESVKQHLKIKGSFNQQRVARIIRQASLALSEAHQNGILHRNLKPQNILLTISETGNEMVKVTDFCVSDGKIQADNFTYKSPEQINGNPPTYASDGYALAVIAYQMLTNRLPFNPATEREMLKSQQKGLTVKVTDVVPEINPLVDKILVKALAYNPSDRYPKARDFGEAFFNAITTASPWEAESRVAEDQLKEVELPKEETKLPLPSNPLIIAKEKYVEVEQIKSDNADISFHSNDISSDIHIDSYNSDINELDEIETNFDEEIEEADNMASTKDSLWEKRSPEPVRDKSGTWIILPILGVLLLFVGVAVVWQLFRGMKDLQAPTVAKSQTPNKKEPTIQNAKPNTNKDANSIDNLEVPPPEREIIPPKGFKYFENVRQNLSDDLAKNYRGFSLHIPADWKIYKSETAYFDAKLEGTENGFPKQQFLVHRYESRGTFEMDKENFPKLVEKSNKDLEKSLNNYDVVSEGGIMVNNGWKAYEVKFKGKSDDGEEIWGRRIWMPAARPFEKNGFVITMLATSLSEKIKGLDDIGKEGELGDILYTFEPSQNY